MCAVVRILLALLSPACPPTHTPLCPDAAPHRTATHHHRSTTMCNQLRPLEVMGFLNRLYSKFDSQVRYAQLQGRICGGWGVAAARCAGVRGAGAAGADW